MCLLCVDWEKRKLTLTEAKRNASEMMESATEEEKNHIDEAIRKFEIDMYFEKFRKMFRR